MGVRGSLVFLCACGRLSFDPVGTPATVDAPVVFLDAGQCPPGYTFAGASCYRVVHTGTGWLEAELACEADAVGAHLVVITDDAERTLVTASVTAVTWIGTSKRQTPAYRTVIDTPAFLELGPQSEPSEECLSIHPDGLMYLHSCADADDYVCEYDGVAAVPSSY